MDRGTGESQNHAKYVLKLSRIKFQERPSGTSKCKKPSSSYGSARIQLRELTALPREGSSCPSLALSLLGLSFGSLGLVPDLVPTSTRRAGSAYETFNSFKLLTTGNTCISLNDNTITADDGIRHTVNNSVNQLPIALCAFVHYTLHLRLRMGIR